MKFRETTMTVKKLKMPPNWREGEQPAGFRIGPNGEVEMMTEAETLAVVWRTIYESMIRAGFRIRPSKRSLH